jgi:hypothetical protein
MTKQEKVAAWMHSLGFFNAGSQTEKPLYKRKDMYLIDTDQATFFYDVMVEALKHGQQVGQYQAADKLYGDVCHIYMFGDNKDSAKAKSISEWSAVGLLKDCEAFMNDNSKAYKEYLRHLKQEGKTNG